MMLGAMSVNTTPMIIINKCAQFFVGASLGKILLLLIQKNVYRDYLHVYSGGVIFPLGIPTLSRNSMAREI